VDRFTVLEAPALALPAANIDTDQIIPGRFLQKPRDGSLGRYLFHDLRQRPDFPLNRPPGRDARIVVAGPNFACGSSRENAVWALYDHGFRAALAPSFGDIFFGNALKNGFLPIAMPPALNARLLGQLAGRPELAIRIDLPAQTVTLPDGVIHGFAIDSFAKDCLINGLDELDYTLSRMPEIAAFERQRPAS
jgi:3-isopropylmalate/(R)-2-methylmalate dehydratase small subunit